MSRNAQASGERGGRTPAGAGATPEGMPGTPGSHLQGPQSGQSMHHQDFHYPSPQHGHMGMGGMHSSPTKMHSAGAGQAQGRVAQGITNSKSAFKIKFFLAY